jgi:hypothetical protein
MKNKTFMQSKISVLIILCILIPVLGVFADQAGPEEIISHYYESLVYGNFDDAYKLLSKEDRAHLTMAEYTDMMMPMWNTGGMLIDLEIDFPDFYRFITENLLRVVPLKIDKSPGRIDMEVEIHTLDIYRVFFELPEAEPIINDPDQPIAVLNEAMMRAVETLYGKEEPPLYIDTIAISIIDEHGEWKIFINIEQQIRSNRSEEIGSEAWSAAFDGNLELARDLYLEALELNPENERFREALEKVEEKLRSQAEKMNARPEPYVEEFIEVWDVRIEEGRFPKVMFSIRNNGDRLVDDIRVRMAYLGPNGEVLAIEMGRIDRYGMPLYPGYDYENNPWTPWQAPMDWDMQNFDFMVLDALGPPAGEPEQSETFDGER